MVSGISRNYLPSCDVLDNPKVESAENNDNEETESFIVYEEAQNEVADERQEFEAKVKHAVAGVCRSFQESGHELLLFAAQLGGGFVSAAVFSRSLDHCLLRATSHGVHLLRLICVVSNFDLEVEVPHRVVVVVHHLILFYFS